MRYLDRTAVALTVAAVALLVADALLADWVRFIGLQSLSRGLVALGMLVLWRTGLISFGHALYFGTGAYVAALLSLVGVTDAVVLVIAGTTVAGVLAYLLGFLLRRYRAIFFALLNLAFSMILYGVLAKTEAIGSTDGLGVAPPTFLGYEPEGDQTQVVLFAFTVVLAYAVAMAVHLYLRSTLGQMTTAVRENEIRLEYLGYSVERAVHVKYVISGITAGLGGVIMALAVGQVDPDSMAYWSVSGDFVFIAILSGPGNVAAPFIGALVYELIRTYAFEYAAHIWQFILGATLLIIIMFLPEGLWSILTRLRRARA